MFQLLSYNPETAGGIMSPDFVAVRATSTVGQALAAVADSTAPPEALNVVYTMAHDGTLHGSAPLASLVRAPTEHSVATVVHEAPPHVHPSWDLDQVARTMSDFNLTVVPVVDREHGGMVGVVTIDDLIELLLPQGWRRDLGKTKGEE